MFHVKHEDLQRVAGFSPGAPIISRLQTFADLLAQWNRHINLVSRDDLPRLWTRHIADSLQLIPLLPQNLSAAIDLGSGAGFPGLVLAIARDIPFTLIEADRRKAVFLAEAARVTNAPVRIENTRIEHAHVRPARLVTARALAPLPALLALVQPILAPDGFALFLAGKNVESELTRVSRRWHMRLERFPSRTNPEASVLKVSEISRDRG
ncbi:MAG: 16S rRNA (guanine(527)-N(7))-methyltransferase RsmG [Acetobacteraceae bacterium]